MKIKNYLNLLIGLLLVAIAFNLFLSPYNLAAGGVSGLSLIVNKIFSINESIFLIVINIILLVFSYILLDKKTTRKTILGSLLFPLFVNLTKNITTYINISNLELIVISVLGGILSGVGYGIIFKSGFTSGGTDIINQIIEKYLKIPMSKSIIIVDGIITILGGFIFGFQIMIYSIISLMLISAFSNKTILGKGDSKTFYIYSKKYEEIKDYLHNILKIDTTEFACIGAYKNKVGKMLLTVVDNNNYYLIKEIIKTIDEKAFIVITDSYHLINANVSINK